MDNQLSLFGLEEPTASKASDKAMEAENNNAIAEQDGTFANTAENVSEENKVVAEETIHDIGDEEKRMPPITEEGLNETIIPDREAATTENPAKEDAHISDIENDAVKKEVFSNSLGTSFGKKGRKSFKEIDAEVDLIQVPSDELLFSKQYYPISQVAKWFRVNNSLLRFWENEFDILKPRKNRKGDRLFRPEDVKHLQVIYYLLRQKKYTIAGARKYIKNNRKTVDANMKIVQTLNDFKNFLLELKAFSE